MFLVILHLIIAITLIFIIIINKSKGSAYGGTFSGSSNTMFGSAGPTSFLAKLIYFLLALFFILAGLINIMNKETSSSSLIDRLNNTNPTIEQKNNRTNDKDSDNIEGIPTN